jgi:hypothetical protein
MGLVATGLGATGAFAEDKTLDLVVNGTPWVKTVVTPYDASSKETRDATFKVYSQVMDFAGQAPITKGLGGQYPHHRGMFIGWRETHVGGKKFDTWHMTDCYQQFNGQTSTQGNTQTLGVEWRGNDGTKIFDEQRIIAASEGPGGIRIFDFTSVLTPFDDIKLRGDSHHAGMQIRLSQELSDHPEQASYVLPEGSKKLENDEVSGAWWAACNAKIGGKDYGVMHMTPPDNPTGIKLYSIRPYARFGAFFEPDLKKGQPMTLTFRIVVSEKPIDAAQAKALYTEYASGHRK